MKFPSFACPFGSPLAVTLLCFASLGNPSLSAQDWARERLNKSPRHGEWVDLKHGDRTIKAFVVYPEAKAKTPAVLVIHEIFGLTDWVRSLADKLAAAGYIAIVPDLLTAPGASTQTYVDVDEARKAIAALPEAQIVADLDAAAAYVTKLPACNGTLAVTGFCWGGGWSFGYANHNPQLKASYVFYGTGPKEAADAAKIPCPVYGFYGENDARVDETIPKAKEIMASLGKSYEPVIYPGAGHGFMRAGESPEASEADRKAHDAAWERWKSLLKKLTG